MPPGSQPSSLLSSGLTAFPASFEGGKVYWRLSPSEKENCRFARSRSIQLVAKEKRSGVFTDRSVSNLCASCGHPNKRSKLWRLDAVAAFCACCGAEITLKTEACPLCGAPQHGMLQPDLLPTFAVITEPSQDDVELVRNRES
jgi:hypothetical protein